MKVNLTCIMLVLDSVPNSDIRKKDTKSVKLLTRRVDNALPAVMATTDCDIKEQIRKLLVSELGTDVFHLEQVYTLGDKKFMSDDTVDVMYLGITNMSYVQNKSSEYQLQDVMIDNGCIKFGDTVYKYQTVEKETARNIEYFHNIDTDDIVQEKILLELLIAWKHLRYRIGIADILFKFLPSEFSLNDVTDVYKIISQKNIDKSNFRKSIIKYCVEIPNKMSYGGYRPCKLYKFQTVKNDKWI